MQIPLPGNRTIAPIHTLIKWFPYSSIDDKEPCKTGGFWTGNFAGFPYGRNRTGLPAWLSAHHPHSSVWRRPQSPGQGHPQRARAARQLLPESVLIRSAAGEKIGEAAGRECEAWKEMWAGGPAMPSPGEPQAEPTIGKATSGGYDLLEAK